MPRTWLFPGLLLAVFAAVSLAQQAADVPIDQERIVLLEQQVGDMQQTVAGLGGDGTVGMTPAALELSLARIEMRLDRLEQQGIRSSGSAGRADRMMDSRPCNLENAVMRRQQQR